MQLDSGRYQGKRILPWEVLQKTRDMNIVTRSRKSTVYPINFQGYGLGVFMADYNGKQVYYHTGGADGFVTNTCFVPEANLGITILTNNDNQGFFEALRYQILDAYLGVAFKNRSTARLPEFLQDQQEAAKKTAALQDRVKDKLPELPLNAYTGVYENELYGPVEIEKTKDGKALSINFKGHSNLRAKVEYMDNGEWLLTYNNLGFGILPITFKTANKKVVSTELRVNEFIDYDSYNFIKK